MNPEIINLNLINPLFFIHDASLKPFEPAISENTESFETLFSFQLDESASMEFEPDKKKFPGTLIFSGRAAEKKIANENAANENRDNGIFELARGNYLFTQFRVYPAWFADIAKTPGKLREIIMDLAIEVQQEGLWQRMKPLPWYCLRYVYEDRGAAVQIFRSCAYMDSDSV